MDSGVGQYTESNDGLYDEIAALRLRVKQLESDLASAQVDKLNLVTERDSLRLIFPKILEALGNGSGCTPDASIEFLRWIPDEVASVVRRLRS
jgi:DNA-directed RNA polymerase alpha subunit